MKKVLIITRTNWNEPPRIRHQITRLLLKKGFQITYIEKNAYENLSIKNRKEEGISFYSHAELIHHQLRYFPIIQKMNNYVVRVYLNKIFKKIEFDFIINFCYEYSFLKELAPGKKIITMIEDNFESQAKFGMTAAIRNQVKETCKNSDHVLTVSYPLMEKLKQYNNDVRMLFPWSQRKYTSPLKGTDKDTVLYFGYVHRLDWKIVERLIRDTKYHFRFVGPTARRHDQKMVEHLKKTYANFEYIPYSAINDLKLDDVFCSILPYDTTIQSVQACTISNRAFNLLSFGLPLAYADLHQLIEAPQSVIRKNKNFEDYQETLRIFREKFYDFQNDIKDFLNNHYEDDRWRILETTINESTHKENTIKNQRLVQKGLQYEK